MLDSTIICTNSHSYSSNFIFCLNNRSVYFRYIGIIYSITSDAGVIGYAAINCEPAAIARLMVHRYQSYMRGSASVDSKSSCRFQVSGIALIDNLRLMLGYSHFNYLVTFFRKHISNKFFKMYLYSNSSCVSSTYCNDVFSATSLTMNSLAVAAKGNSISRALTPLPVSEVLSLGIS